MQKKPFIFLRLVSLICLLALLVPAPLQAQTDQPGYIINRFQQNANFVDPAAIGAEAVPGFQLDFDFTMLDKDAVQTTDIDTSQLTVPGLPDAIQVFAGRIATPWRVVVVVDASATMANFNVADVFKKLKADVSALFGGNNSQTPITFAVLKFDDVPSLVADFDTANDQLPKNVQAMTAKQTGNSCFYDAIGEALTRLAGTGGRQAILAITASRDNCTDQSQDAVITKAQQGSVQIYPVGISGFGVDKSYLDPLAQGTGGLTNVVDAGKLAFALTPAQTTFANQWNAKVTLYPKNGSQIATLIVKLKNGQNLALQIPFTSDRDYLPPPSIAMITPISSKTNGVSFTLSFTSKEKISAVNVKIVNKQDNSDAGSGTYHTDTPTILVASSALVTGNVYTLTVVALDDQNRELKQSKIVQDFTYQPVPLSMTLRPPQVLPDNATVTVQADPAKPEGVNSFKLQLTDKDKNPLPYPPVTIAASDAPDGLLTLKLPTDLPTGSYMVVVQVVDQNGNALGSVPSQPFNFIQPTWFDKMINWLKTNPLALSAIGAVCCLSVVGLGGVAWFFVPKGGSKVKEVEIFVPEKQRRSVSSTSSGVFDSDAKPPPQPQARQEPPPQRAAPQARPPARPADAAPAVSVPPAVLSAQEPVTALLRTPIRKSPCTIGRRDGNDIVLKVDGSSGVSGQHCAILFQNGQFFVLDEGSSFGTTVNGQTAPKGRPTPLPDGAVIGLGPKVKIQFRLGQ
jgi:hypothetical protein